MGEAVVILGIRIKRENKGLTITQSHYIEKILKKFNCEGYGPVSTPMEAGIKLVPHMGKPVNQLEYSRAIGCLMYVMTSTRPDITYAVRKLSRFTSNPSNHHWEAIIRVFKYLKKTMDYGLSYVGFPLVIEGYSDASWITNNKDHTSTTGWVFDGVIPLPYLDIFTSFRGLLTKVNKARVTPTDIQHSAATRFGGCIDCLSFLRHNLRFHILMSTPTSDPAESSGEPMRDGGKDRDDDDGDSSGDDADDEDEDKEKGDEEEEEHLALADSAVVIPTASISLPPEAEVERLLAMPTPSPSPPISLSPPFAGIASTQALVNAVTAALTSPPLPPLPPSLYIPPPVDRRDDIPKSERPPCKRSCLFALGSRYEVGESSTTRPTEDRRVDPAEAVPEIAPMTMGEAHSIGLSQTVHHELQTHHDHVYGHETQIQAHQTQLQLQGTLIQTQHQVHETRSQMQQAEMAKLRETDRKRKGQMVEIHRVIRGIRREMSDMQAELLTLGGQQRARQPRPDARIPDDQDASGDVDSHI
ncbi:hypothetical protein Tco_0071768 [Tanacetum coccineum]